MSWRFQLPDSGLRMILRVKALLGHVVYNARTRSAAAPAFQALGVRVRGARLLRQRIAQRGKARSARPVTAYQDAPAIDRETGDQYREGIALGPRARPPP